MISNTQLISSSLLGALGAKTTSNAYKSAMSSSLSNIENTLNLRNTQRTIFEEQDREISQALGHKLTENDLEIIKAASRLKAASAETGTSGGTTSLAQVEPYVIGARNRANLIQGSRNQKLDLARRNLMSRLDSQNRIQSAIQDIPSASDINLNMLNSVLGGISTGIGLGRSIDSAMKSQSELDKLKKQNEILSKAIK